mmetsp:Transcript_59632/g.126287  ORF Transcript_59632/g.126287 Transcript_59632/m.126287 type:complete len:758 (-) Transcript_59632:198-2471(-)
MTDPVATAHELLTLARDSGADADTWESIFESLRECPAALARPPPRKMTLLHQAAYWGNVGAVETLLAEFSADPTELTADGLDMDAAAVAKSEGHTGLALMLQEAADKKKLKLKATASKEPTAEEVSLAHELLNEARDSGGEDATWTSIFNRLRKSPAALIRPSVRKFSLLHQAAYWGKRAAVEILLGEFGADPTAATADDDALDAAGVAKSAGFEALANWIRTKSFKPKEAVPTSSSSSSTTAASDTSDLVAAAADAPSPYAIKASMGGKDNGQQNQGAGAVRVWLCLRDAKPGASSAAKAKKEWRLYSPEELSILETERTKGNSSAKLPTGGGTVHFDEGFEKSASSGDRPVQSFTVSWEWDAGEGGKAAPEWKPYSKEAQFILENAICNAMCSAEITTPGSSKPSYVVDLIGFRQYSSKDDFKCRRVRRSGVPLKDQYPKEVLDPKTGKRLLLDSVPSYWKLDPQFFSGVAKRFDLPMDHEVVMSIAKWMNATIRQGHKADYGQVPGAHCPTRGMEVVKVEVVMQPRLWRRYCCYKGKLKEQAKAIKSHAGTSYLKKNPMAMPLCSWLDQDVMESYFWHGCGKSEDGSLDSIDAIIDVGPIATEGNPTEMVVNDGASSRFSKPTSMFGAGVYLADLSSKANLYVPCPKCHKGAYFRDLCKCSPQDVEDAGPYRMLLMRAALGRVHIEHNHKDEAYKGAFNPAKKYHADSVMGEIGGALTNREYVVYNDSAVYPEFIVHYKRRAKAICCKIDEKCK